MHDGAYFEAVNGLCKARAPEGINFERFTLYRLRLDWSPEQIAGWLKRTHPEDECNQVSHETIYRSLFVQARGVLKKELLSHLRSKRSMRRSKPVDPNVNGDISRISSQSVSDWRRLKIGRCLVTGRAISCPGRNIDVYFCDPQSPWQRGSNENTNGLLRQYFLKGTDLSVHSQAHLNKVARQLNERPRETLQFETPAERFNACVAATA